MHYAIGRELIGFNLKTTTYCSRTQNDVLHCMETNINILNLASLLRSSIHSPKMALNKKLIGLGFILHHGLYLLKTVGNKNSVYRLPHF